MQTHKYGVGALVHFSGGTRFGAAAGAYEVVGLLPVQAGELLYKIKSTQERHERVVDEAHLIESARSE